MGSSIRKFVLLQLVLLQCLAVFARRRVPRSLVEDKFDDEEGEGEGERDGDGRRLKSVSDYLLPPTPSDKSLEDRNLLATSSLDVYSLLDGHHLYRDKGQRHFSSAEVLAYVTPWNKAGYEMSLIATRLGKLDYVVPTWFRVVRQASEIHLEGAQDVNVDWLQAIRQTAQQCTGGQDVCPSPAKILPRVKVETDLNSGADVAAVGQLCSFLRDKHGFEGFTLEMNLNALERVAQLTYVLAHDHKLVIVLVLPPVLVADPNMKAALKTLTKHAHRLSVMTYDHPNEGHVGPNAPLPWVRQVMSSLSFDEEMRSKLLLGLPFYGWRGEEALTAQTFTVWLASEAVEAQWDYKAKEHLFSSPQSKKQPCYYPTPAMLRARAELAEELGIAGVGVWEFGQGLAAFLDVF